MRTSKIAILMLVIIVLPLVFEFAEGKEYYWPYYELHSDVMRHCCRRGKRETAPKIYRQMASSFLKRRKRDLRQECCVEGCSVEEVKETSLHEECIREGCSVQEIIEACRL